MMDVMWWACGVVLWLTCGVLAYGSEFAWHVGVHESYPHAGNDFESLRSAQIVSAFNGLLGPIGFLIVVLVTSSIPTPRQSRRLRWRNPAKALHIIRVLQQSGTDPR